jgi:hypothetical protein
MLSGKKKIQIFAAFGTLLLFAVIVGCNGFFVDPVLTSMAVGPTATINQNGTVQESAVGTYNDGSQKSVSDVQWSTSDSTIASINVGGLVTGNSPGTATITGASAAVSGTSTITVTLGNVTALKLDPTSGTVPANGGQTTITALATVQGSSTPVDVSATATWTVSDTTNFQISQGQDPATLQSLTGSVAGVPVTVTATYQSTSQVQANGVWRTTP